MYIYLFIITFILTIFSFYFRFLFYLPQPKLLPAVPNKSKNWIGMFLARYFHYLLLIYFSLFLIFYKEKESDAIIYIVLAILLCYSWVYFECCILSYYELIFYGVNHRKYLTTFHPCLYELFGNYQSIPLYLSGIIMFFTVFYLLIKNKSLPLEYRIFAGSIFFFLFMYNLLSTRYYDNKLYYND